MIEADAEGDDPFQALEDVQKEQGKLFRAEREMYGEIVNDIRQIMTEYFSYYPEKDLRFERRDGKSGEHEFNIELYEYQLPHVVWNGKIDATAKTPNKLRWIVERKTFSRKPTDDDRWRNLQSSTYLRATEMLGWGEYDGMCWDYIRSKPPVVPGLLQNGNLSEKAIDSLPVTILEAIEGINQKPKTYESFLERSKQQLPTWFFRIHTPVNREVVDRVFDDFISTIRLMADQHGRVRDKNIDRHCLWCDFESICRAELQGNDVDFVKQKEFTVAKTDQSENALTDSTE
jgi:hypothetical protein